MSDETTNPTNDKPEPSLFDVLLAISELSDSTKKALQELGSTITAHYERETKRGDEHEERLKRLEAHVFGNGAAATDGE